MTPAEVAEIQAYKDQAAAAWSAARAAWLQALLTPVGITVGLLTATLVPVVSRHTEKRRLRRLAVSVSAEVAGAIGLLSKIVEAPEFIGNVHSALPTFLFRNAQEGLSAFPRPQLGDAKVDTALRMLALQLAGVTELAGPTLDRLSKGPLPAEALEDLRSRAQEAAKWYAEICAAAGVKPDNNDKLVGEMAERTAG